MKFSNLHREDLEKVLAFDEFAEVSGNRKEEVIRAIKDDSAYIMKNNNEIIGYAIFRSYGFLEEPFLHLIVIRKEFRGNGYAKEFIQYFESISKTTRIHISTNTTNIPMRRLLKSLGYLEDGIIRSIEPEDPEIFYYKTL